jgi:putative ABC transport system permease protein
MFDVPFKYGAGWDQAADDGPQMVAVLSKKTNDRAFGGTDSVGQIVRLDGREYKVIGVLGEWAPTPKFYDMNNGAFDEPEEIFVPFAIGQQFEMQSAGNTNCWRDQQINNFQDFINSDCVWIQFWVEMRDSSKAAAFKDFIDNYVREQKSLGRFERPLNNHLRHPDEPAPDVPGSRGKPGELEPSPGIGFEDALGRRDEYADVDGRRTDGRIGQDDHHDVHGGLPAR